MCIRDRFLAEKEAEYTKLFAKPYNAAKYGYIDDVIEPRNTRFQMCIRDSPPTSQDDYSSHFHRSVQPVRSAHHAEPVRVLYVQSHQSVSYTHLI